MLRLLVILLLLANGAYFAWSQGHLAVFGLVPANQTEPGRMQTQIKPEVVRLLNASDARRLEVAAAAPAPKPPECLQSALLDERVAQTVRSAANSLPAGSWSLDAATEPARWIVYMGKYPAADVMAKKKAELRQLGVNFEALQNTSLEPGISLGGHADQASANKELADLNKRGVRTARVLQEKAPAKGQVLRLPAVDDALRGQLDGVRTALGSVALRICKTS